MFHVIVIAAPRSDGCRPPGPDFGAEIAILGTSVDLIDSLSPSSQPGNTAKSQSPPRFLQAPHRSGHTLLRPRTVQTDYAAFLIGVSFAGSFMGGAAATSGSSPQIHESNRVTTQPKPVMILPNNSTMPMLAIQLLKSHAENMIAPPERR